MKNFFYYLSKTAPDLIQRCSESSKLHRRALGALVFVVGCFAFLSGFVLMNSAIGEWDDFSQSFHLTPAKLILSLLVALLYCSVIVIIDREVVSARTKLAVIPRLFLAAIISIVVSIPLEMYVLKEKITEHIQAANIRNSGWFYAQKAELQNETQTKINQLDSIILSYEKTMNDYKEIYLYELTDLAVDRVSGVPGKGPRYKAALQSYNHYADQIQKKEVERNGLKDNLAAQIADLEKDKQVLTNNTKQGLVTRLEAMFLLKSNDESGVISWIIIGLTAFFFFMEVTPSFIKLLSTKSDYDMLQDYMDEVAAKKLEKALADEDYNNDFDGFIKIPELQIGY